MENIIIFFMEINIIYFSFIYSTNTIWQPTKNYFGKILWVNKWFRHGPCPQGIYCLWEKIHNKIFIKWGLYQVMLSYTMVKELPQNLYTGFCTLFNFFHVLPPEGRYPPYIGLLFHLLQPCDNPTSTGNF